MSTNSTIIVHRKDGKWSRVYCHWDGYPSWNGKYLFKYYNTQKKAEALVALGNISSLHEKMTQPKGHTFDEAKPGYTVFYHRDRGEDWSEQKPKIYKTKEEAIKDPEEYAYVWDKGKWWLHDYPVPFVELKTVLENIKED